MPLGRCSPTVWLSCTLQGSLALVRLRKILYLATGARDLAVHIFGSEPVVAFWELLPLESASRLGHFAAQVPSGKGQKQ